MNLAQIVLLDEVTIEPKDLYMAFYIFGLGVVGIILYFAIPKKHHEAFVVFFQKNLLGIIIRWLIITAIAAGLLTINSLQ